MYFLRSGEVMITVDGHDLDTLGPGTYFGEVSVLTNERRLYTVIATRPSDIMILQKVILKTKIISDYLIFVEKYYNRTVFI